MKKLITGIFVLFLICNCIYIKAQDTKVVHSQQFMQVTTVESVLGPAV